MLPIYDHGKIVILCSQAKAPIDNLERIFNKHLQQKVKNKPC
jgi:hypothetical protein